MHLNRLAALFAAAGAAGTLVMGCGGGSGGDTPPPPPPASTTTAVSGVVADGPLSGATVCYDINENGACDPGEPTSATATDTDGRYSLEVPNAEAGLRNVIANVPASAIDRDTGLPVGTAFTLRAPPGAGGTVFVSPLSTLVLDARAASGGSTAEAEASIRQQLGLANSPLANYVSGSDTQAARLARTVNEVIIEVTTLAAAANVPADQTRALVASVTLGNLPALAALAAAGTGTPAEVAEQVATQVLADRNLTPATVAAQAQVSQQSAAPLQVLPVGPFISLRDFTYTDANNYNYRLFTGDSGVLDASGAFVANEIRSTLSGGAALAFNRNQAYWTGSAWQVCARAWQVVSTVAQSATQPQRSNYCGGSRFDSRITEKSIAGRRMADVVAEMRAFALPDRDGLPTSWGPDPALLGDAAFPADSSLNTRESIDDVGNSERYGVLDKAAVRFPDNSFRHAATFDDMVDGMPGNFVNAAAVVDGGNALFLQDIAAPQPADPALRPAARFNIAFHPDTTAVRFFKCNVVNANNTSTNCVAVGDGTRTGAEAKGDAQVMRIASGYPTELINATKTQRFFVQRNGVISRGNTDLQRTVHSQRLNDVAWNALRTQLGIPAHTEATAPPVNPPTNFLRTFTYTDANNYFYRQFIGSGVPDSAGVFTSDEHRIQVSAGVRQPVALNYELWTGSEWYACPNDLIGVNLFRRDPRDFIYCRGFEGTYTEAVVATLDGRLMTDIVRDIRRYSSKDGTFAYQGWGPNPDTTAALAGAVFPAGSSYAYQRNDQTREPETVGTGDDSRVRVAPNPSNVPFDTWPFPATLDEVIDKYPGNLRGATALNGATTVFAGRYFVTPSDPAYTSEVQIRVAFDANGNKARMYRSNVAVANGALVNFVAVLDTTYTIETVGGRRVLHFAQMPAELIDRTGLERSYIERNGQVWYGGKTRIFPNGQHTIRLNGTAWDALRTQLGLVGI